MTNGERASGRGENIPDLRTRLFEAVRVDLMERAGDAWWALMTHRIQQEDRRVPTASDARDAADQLAHALFELDPDKKSLRDRTLWELLKSLTVGDFKRIWVTLTLVVGLLAAGAGVFYKLGYDAGRRAADAPAQADGN